MEINEYLKKLKNKDSLLLTVIGNYAVALSVLTLFGLLVSFFYWPDTRGAIYMPFRAFVIAAALFIAGWGIIQNQNYARYLFFIAAPWGSLALASVLPGLFWKEDLPYTSLLIFIYGPLSFLLARNTTLELMKVEAKDWKTRGGTVLAVAAGIMLVARLLVGASKPRGGGFFSQLNDLNAYVQKLVMCDVPLWNYLIALLVVSAPVILAKMQESQTGNTE